MFPRNSWLLEKFPEVIIFGIKLEKMSDKLPERLGYACWLEFHNFLLSEGLIMWCKFVCRFQWQWFVISDGLSDKRPNFECLNIYRVSHNIGPSSSVYAPEPKKMTTNKNIMIDWLMFKLRSSTANVITFPSGWPNQQLIADSVDVLLINRYIQIQNRQDIYR